MVSLLRRCTRRNVLIEHLDPLIQFVTSSMHYFKYTKSTIANEIIHVQPLLYIILGLKNIMPFALFFNSILTILCFTLHFR